MEHVVFQPERHSPTMGTMTNFGSLKEWQDNVAAKCSAQPFLIFYLCASFAGVLLKFARMDSFGFNYYGRSSHGKTTAAQVAASVWGCGADPADASELAYIRKWNTTANALEALAASHNDNVMILDELGTCSVKDFSNVVYNLLGGQGKSAMDSTRKLKAQRTWRILLLSTGEISSKQKIEEDRRQAKAGQLVRLIDIPTGAGIIRDVENPKAFVDGLKRACGQHFGSAGPAFVQALIDVAESSGELRDSITELMDGVGRRLTPCGAEPEISRATMRFALAEMAGLLAVRLGTLPLKEEEVCDSVSTVYRAWLQEAVSIPDAVRGVESVRDFILRYREGRFKKLNSDNELYIRDLVGYWDQRDQRYLLTPEGFKEACGGHDLKQVAGELSKQQLLFKNEGDRYMTKHQIPGDNKQTRFYAVKEEILGCSYDIPGVPDPRRVSG